jgi:hypothetical protein
VLYVRTYIIDLSYQNLEKYPEGQELEFKTFLRVATQKAVSRPFWSE